MSSYIRDEIRDQLLDWDTVIIGSVCVPCIFDNVYSEGLEVSGTEPLAQVATADIFGNARLFDLEAGVTTCTVETQDGRTEGPFIIQVPEPSDPGMHFLRLSLVA